MIWLRKKLRGVTIIKGVGFDMVNPDPGIIDIKNMNYGMRNSVYDKVLLFNKNHINDINYNPGCHSCNPIGNINYNKNQYKLYHNKYV